MRTPKFSYWRDAPQPRNQIVLFPETLEDRIPEDHPVRLVDEILDHLDWTNWESVYHGSAGAPPIHPSVLAKVLLFGMIRRIRSSRQLKYAVNHSIDFIWLASGHTFDHSTISEFRRLHKKELVDIFRQMIKFAIDLNLANLSELCIDGTRVLGDANKYKTWTAKRLSLALEQLDEQISEALENFGLADEIDEDLLGQDISADRLPPGLADLQARREQLAAHQATLKEMDAIRKKNGTKGPAQIPKTDIDSRILPNKEGGYDANYTPMATTETGLGMIVNSDVVIGNVEHDQFSVIVDQVQSDFEVNVERVLADSAYTTGKNLVAAQEKDVQLIGPLAEKKSKENPALREDPTQPVAEELIDTIPINTRTNGYDKTAFVYNQETDSYFCPAGKELPLRIIYSEGTPNERKAYRCNECDGCPLAAQCVRKSDKAGREVIDNIHEPIRREHRETMATDQAQEAYRRRPHFGEVPFAVIKVMFAMRRFSLRGIQGVEQEWRWATTAFNLKKLMGVLAAIRADSNNEQKTVLVYGQ